MVQPHGWKMGVGIWGCTVKTGSLILRSAGSHHSILAKIFTVLLLGQENLISFIQHFSLLVTHAVFICLRWST